MGMSSVKQDVRFGWNVKNFAQKLLISPKSTQKREGFDQQQTWRLSFIGGGRGLIDSELGGCHL